MSTESKIYIGVIVLLAIVIGVLGFSIKKQVEIITTPSGDNVGMTSGQSEKTLRTEQIPLTINTSTTTVCSFYNSTTRNRLIKTYGYYFANIQDTIASTTNEFPNSVGNKNGFPGLLTMSIATSSNAYSTTTNANTHYLYQERVGTSSPYYLVSSSTPQLAGGVVTQSGSYFHLWKAGSYLLFKLNNYATTTTTGFCFVDYWGN